MESDILCADKPSWTYSQDTAGAVTNCCRRLLCTAAAAHWQLTAARPAEVVTQLDMDLSSAGCMGQSNAVHVATLAM